MGTNWQVGGRRSDHRIVVEPGGNSPPHWREDLTIMAPGIFVPG